MKFRRFLKAVGHGAALLISVHATTSCAQLGAIALTEADVQQRVQTQFPVARALPLAGTLTLSNPVVNLRDPKGRVGLLLDAALGVPQFGRVTGQTEVSGAVRFDASKGQFMLDDARVESLRIPGVPPSYLSNVQSAANAAVAAALQSLPIYTLRDENLAEKYAKANLKSVRIEDRKLLLDFN